MTKLLMSCDEYVYMHDGRYYAGNQERFDFFERYLRVFDSLKLVLRCEEEKELKKGRVPLNQDPRIEFIPVPMFHGPKDYAKKYFAVGKVLNNVIDDCDAAILRLPSTVAMRIGKQVLRKGVPYACEVVFDPEDFWKCLTGINRIAWKRVDKQMRYLCAKADGVSCVTEHYLQRHYYPTKPDAFTSNYSSLSLPAEFYLSNREFPKHKPFVIAHTANQIEFDGRKGHVEIVKSISLLKQKGIDVVVRFAGKDYFGGVDRLNALAKELNVLDNVQFLGFLSREELDNALNESDIYVMPTRAEGLPRVIIEAMAKGLPCITTPVSGNPELIDEHFLVPYEDINTLADRIEELCIDTDLYEKTSLINFERSKKYEASILQKKRDEFYKKLKELIKEK